MTIPVDTADSIDIVQTDHGINIGPIYGDAFRRRGRRMDGWRKKRHTSNSAWNLTRFACLSRLRAIGSEPSSGRVGGGRICGCCCIIPWTTDSLNPVEV